MGRLTGLDALRGIAALLVFALHLHLTFDVGAWFIERSYLAVDFFFVLSGFVMAKAYEKGGKFAFTAKGFFALRYARLWPAMAVGAVLATACMIQRGYSAPTIFILIAPLLVLVPNPLISAQGYFTLNPPAWSIFMELVANTLHAVVLWRLPVKALLAIVVAVLIATQFVSLGLNFTHAELPYKGLGRVIAGYTLGVALSRVVLPKIHPAIGLAGLPLSVIALSQAPAVFDLVFLALCPVFIISGLSMRDSKAASFIGALSFPLYAVHTPVMLFVDEADGGPLLAAALALIVALATAALVDKRILRLFAKPGGELPNALRATQ